ncbi:MAG: hypothetical protein IPO81_12265 [Kouleothrix sp.]|nr:hypothetical protein [Kouleothrix sp.]
MTPAGVPAAPNQSRITANLLKVTQSPSFRDKWQLDLEIVEVESVQGGSFVQKGQLIQGFTIAETCAVAAGDTISATAEFLGDPRGGQLRLTNVRAAARDASC